MFLGASCVTKSDKTISACFFTHVTPEVQRFRNRSFSVMIKDYIEHHRHIVLFS